ncbi:MAG: dihydrofolate reductase family protein, partial [Nitrososphaerales archaeon]
MARPHIILNSAMTLDGKIASKSGDSSISSRADLRRVHLLRTNVDAIIVGIETVIKDDPLLTVRLAKGGNPLRVIVDSKARIPLSSNLLTSLNSGPVAIAISSSASDGRIKKIASTGSKILRCGSSGQVDLSIMLDHLKEMGIRKALLEGGGNLNAAMLAGGFVDEVMLAVAPVIIGGVNSTTLVEGKGVDKVKD